jgi:PAS domain S-box-containing protein
MYHLQNFHNFIFLIFIICSSILVSPCEPVFASSEIVSVKIAISEYSSGSSTDTSKNISGFWIEFLNYIGKKEKWKIEYIHDTLDNNLTALESEAIDIMPGVTFTEERKKIFVFSEKPALINWAYLFVNISNTNIKSVADLKNSKIGALKGSPELENEEGLKKILHKFNIPCTFVELDNYAEIIQEIKQNRVDGGVINRNFTNKNALNHGIKQTAILFNPVSLQFAFPKNSNITPVLVKTINLHMEHMVADNNSFYYQLLTKYFDREPPQQDTAIESVWIKASLISSTALLLFSILFIIGSRFQGYKKSSSLKNKNEGMKRDPQYQNLRHDTPDIQYRTNLDGKVVYLAGSVLKLTGYTIDEILGRKVTDFYLNPEKRKALTMNLQQKGYVNNFVVQLKRKDNSLCWAAVNAQFHKNDAGNILGMNGTLRDVTEQKQALIALEQSEQRLQLALEAANVGIWDWNIQTNEIYCNPRYFTMLGYGHTELPHTLETWKNLLHPEERESVKQQIQNCIEKGGPGEWNMEVRVRAKDGHYKWVLGRGKIVEHSSDGTPIRAAGTRLDITNRKEAEKNLIRAKEEWENTFNAIPDIVTLQDTEMRIVKANKSAINFLGKDFDEIVGQYCYKAFFDYGEPCENCPGVLTLRCADTHAATIEHKELNKIFHVSSSPVLDQQNNIQFFVRIAKDTTELKHLENQLQQSQKMEAIGMMAGGVAHDLNNILAGIISYPELLLLQLPESSELRAPIEAIQQSGNRAATVVADLLTVARGVASTREPYDINTLINEYLCSPEYKNLLSHHPGVVCSKQLNAPHPVILCSPMHIKKIIMNLMANAMESLDNNAGNVSISTSNQQVELKKDTIKQGDISNECVLLTIRDNGPGISDEDVDHIFEPFYSKKVMGKSGTGLGLAIVWNSVQDHNGRILVMSSDEGTQFQVSLPVTTEKNIPQIQNEKKDNLRGDGEHILIIDDEPHLRDIATLILTKLGYRVDTVSSGEAAIEYAKNHHIDLLVIDMLMEPGINGLNTYKEILQQHPNQKAIIASGYSESSDVRAALKLGAKGFIKKPYSIHQISLAVKEALHPLPC